MLCPAGLLPSDTHSQRAIRILPGQRTLAFEDKVVKIYAIDASGFCPTSGQRIVTGPPAMPLHTLSLPGMNPFPLCPLHIDLLGNASLYLPCAHAVVKLTIHNDSQPPTTVDYLTHNEAGNRVRAVTHHRAYFRRATTETAVLLAREYDERWNQVWEIEGRCYDWGSLVDDYSGRIVERARTGSTFIVLLRSKASPMDGSMDLDRA